MTRRETPFFIVNVEAVVRRGQKYLLTLRSDAEPNAPGTLALPGGKVEFGDAANDTLEQTLKREVMEETGLEVKHLRYLESKWFRTDDGEPVVDVVFLCDYAGGDAAARDPAEIAEVMWLNAAEVATHPKAPVWTQQSIEKVERLNRETT